MSGFAIDWINLALRWFHLIVGIAWIGASFHFIWLDFSLRARERMNDGRLRHVLDGAWRRLLPRREIHGRAGRSCRPTCTGSSGRPISPSSPASAARDPVLLERLDLHDRPGRDGHDAGPEAIADLASCRWRLVGSSMTRSAGRRSARTRPVLAVAVFVLIVGAAFIFTHVFSGRGAFIHVGAFIGTIMAANVFCVIIPNQKIVTADLLAGRTPGRQVLGKIGKQRSLHNNYLTLPVLLFMVSNHYPFLYSHPHARGWSWR